MTNKIRWVSVKTDLKRLHRLCQSRGCGKDATVTATCVNGESKMRMDGHWCSECAKGGPTKPSPTVEKGGSA